MKNFFKRNFIWATLCGILAVGSVVFGAKILDAVLTIGDGSSIAALKFDTGEGASNAKISVPTDGSEIQLNKRLQFGTGTAADQVIEADKGSGATNPLLKYNNSTSKWQFTDDGTNFLNMNEETAVQITGLGSNQGLHSNVRISAAGTTGMKVTSSGGTALSPVNPAAFIIKRTGGVGDIALTLEADVQWDTAGLVGTAAADFTGAYWTDATESFETFEPNFVIHACNLDDTAAGVFIMIYPYVRQFMPSSGNNIGYIENAPVTNDANSVFVVKTGITPASYTSKNCIPIGSIRLKKNSSDVWRVADAVSGGQNASFGIRTSQWSGWTSEPGLFGAATGTFFVTAGGPTWSSFVCGGSTPMVKTQVNASTGRGYIQVTTGNCSTLTNGSNGSALRLALPFPASSVQPAEISSGMGKPCGQMRLANVIQPVFCQVESSGTYMEFVKSDGTKINNNSFSNAADDIEIYGEYVVLGR